MNPDKSAQNGRSATAARARLAAAGLAAAGLAAVVAGPAVLDALRRLGSPPAVVAALFAGGDGAPADYLSTWSPVDLADVAVALAAVLAVTTAGGLLITLCHRG